MKSVQAIVADRSEKQVGIGLMLFMLLRRMLALTALITDIKSVSYVLFSVT